MANESNINLAIKFNATADTPRVPARVIAEMVKDFLAASLDAANVRVEVHGAALDYREAYEREHDAFGNAAKDGLN